MNKTFSGLSKRLLFGATISLVVIGGGFALTGFTGSQPDSLSSAQPPGPIEGATPSAMRERLLAEYPDAKVESSTLIKAVTLQDAPKSEANCLQEQGFDSHVTAGDAVFTHVANGEDEAFQIARVACATEYPIQTKYTKPLTATQTSLLYNYQKNVLSTCLNSHGFTVPDAPQLSKFQSNYGSDDTWQPYAQGSAARLGDSF